MSTRPGRVRAARLTDLAAMGELSRLSQGDERDEASVRSLGLPVSGTPIGIFSLFRMPLGALRQNDALYVYEDDRRIAGLLRVERDPQRDEWTIVELDAVGLNEAGDIRFRLVQHLLRDAAKRGAARLHVACVDRGGNVELFMQAGFARYGEEWVLVRPPGHRLPPASPEVSAAAARVRPVTPLDALPLSRLHAAATPPPVARLEDYRLPDWERQASQWRVPRSSLTPILRFADVSAFVEPCPPGPDEGELAGLVQVGVAKEDQPHYLRVCVRPGHDASALIDFGLRAIAEAGPAVRPAPLRGRHLDHGVISPVRTYEQPLDRRLEEVGFQRVAVVTLLVKETLVRVAEPALVPAVR